MYTTEREKKAFPLCTLCTLRSQIIPLSTLTLVRIWYEESTPRDCYCWVTLRLNLIWPFLSNSHPLPPKADNNDRFESLKIIRLVFVLEYIVCSLWRGKVDVGIGVNDKIGHFYYKIMVELYVFQNPYPICGQMASFHCSENLQRATTYPSLDHKFLGSFLEPSP